MGEKGDLVIITLPSQQALFMKMFPQRQAKNVHFLLSTTRVWAEPKD